MPTVIFEQGGGGGGVPRLDESESGEPSSLFYAKAGMLARVLVCNYARFPMNTITS